MKTAHKALFLIVLFIVIIGVVLSSSSNKRTVSTSAQPWYAVHLANGQVYFGNAESVTPDTIALANTYFLETYTAPSKPAQIATSTSFQITQQESAPQQIYNLARRGEANNMTTDNTLYIDRRAVLFWEKLSPMAPMTKWLEQASKQK